ncbi:arsenate reductase/protein-tyrosine-phosphatase family protein [Nocardia veterana]
MAHGFLDHLAGDRIEVRSAGTEPADRINPVVIAAMREVGIDIAAGTPTVLTPDSVRISDVVITMGCGDRCPRFPGVDYRDWTIDGPARRSVAPGTGRRISLAKHPSVRRNPLLPRVGDGFAQPRRGQPCAAGPIGRLATCVPTKIPGISPPASAPRHCSSPPLAPWGDGLPILRRAIRSPSCSSRPPAASGPI